MDIIDYRGWLYIYYGPPSVPTFRRKVSQRILYRVPNVLKEIVQGVRFKGSSGLGSIMHFVVVIFSEVGVLYYNLCYWLKIQPGIQGEWYRSSWLHIDRKVSICDCRSLLER